MATTISLEENPIQNLKSKVQNRRGVDYNSYLRSDKMPTLWCSGCGDGLVMKGLIRAVDELAWDKNSVAVVSGIGCSGRMSSYLDFNTLHTPHGRTLPFATGLKLAKPDSHLIIIAGDGDALAIGGNHFLHACRRNIDLTLIIINNFIYGLTGGQFSPTTPITTLAVQTETRMNAMLSPTARASMLVAMESVTSMGPRVGSVREVIFFSERASLSILPPTKQRMRARPYLSRSKRCTISARFLARTPPDRPGDCCSS